MDDTYELVERFWIDDGELDGLAPQCIFCLGVEYQMVRQEIQIGGTFTRQMHLENKDRIEKILKKQNRQYRFEFMKDDPSESWVVLFCQGETE